MMIPPSQDALFKETLQRHLHGFEGIKPNFPLTPAELSQLKWYELNIDPQSPENRNRGTASPAVKLHFEVERALARAFGFTLLYQRDEETAYATFTKDQEPHVRLDKASFSALRREVASFSVDVQDVIRATSFLSISVKAKEILKNAGLTLSDDSEVFLTQLAEASLQNPTLFPVIQELTPYQRTLLVKAYWPDTHFRHLLFLEGGENMVQMLVKGIKDGTFTKEDFIIWKWRWRVNLFGFKGGYSAKNYDAITHKDSLILLSALEELFDNPDMNFMLYYLNQLQALLNLDSITDLSADEKAYITKMAVSLHDIKGIASSEGAILVVNAYLKFKNAHPQKSSELIALFFKFFNNPDIKTPTYAPAVLNTAYQLFLNDTALKELLPPDISALQAAIIFSCHYSIPIYEKALSAGHPRISCRLFSAKDSLKTTLVKWLENGMNAEFIIGSTGELELANALPPAALPVDTLKVS
jgi:hypothetical protein